MRLRTPLLIAAATTALIGSFAMPASAAPGDTIVTFTIDGGLIAIAPAAGAALTDGTSGDGHITGALGEVTVTDARGSATAWVASASSTTFALSPSVSGSVSTAVTYNAGIVDTSDSVGSALVPDGEDTALTGTNASVVRPTTVSGNNIATWTPTLDVTMPLGALAGDYTGTVTTSVL